jgi:hypothetical protein
MSGRDHENTAPAGDSNGPSKTKSREPKHSAVVRAGYTSGWAIRTLVWHCDTRSAPTCRANCRGSIPPAINFWYDSCVWSGWLGLETPGLYWFRHKGGALRLVRESVPYAHRGLVVGGTSLGREREEVPSLCREREQLMLDGCGVLLFVLPCSYILFVRLFTIPTSPFIVQGGPAYMG